MVRCAVVSLVVLILAAAAPNAEAKCAGPGVVLTPASGNTAGVSWVFVPSYHEPKIAVDSRHVLDVEIEKVSENESFKAYRVSVAYSESNLEKVAVPAYTVRVDPNYGRELSASYRLVDTRPDTPSERVLLTDPTYTQDAWTCSHTDMVSARPTVDASAYRIEWARTEADYRAGKREVLVVPSSMELFWGDKSKTAIELGHLNCFGETIPSDALAETAFVGLVPLGNWEPGSAPEHPMAIRSGEPPTIEVLGEPEPEPEPEPDSNVEAPEWVCGTGLMMMAEERERERRERERDGLPLGLLLALAGALAGLPLGIRAARKLDRRAAARLDALSLPQIAVVAGVVAMTTCAPLAAAGGFIAGASASIAGTVTALRRRPD